MTKSAQGLTTDLYELTMAAAYFENGLHLKRGIFDLFVRRLPPHRSFLVVAGLEQALDYLSDLCFTGDQIDYLREHPSFANVSSEFFDYLAALRFTGDVWAMTEGSIAFGMEPILRVTAPLIEAQLVETFLLSTINHQTMVASKAARVVAAAKGRGVVEFGTRRAHGTQAGLLGARAAYIGGCVGTSNVDAGYRFGIPTFGTLAHSFIMSFDDEDEAFRAFLKVFPTTATILVDTYDTLSAVRRLARNFGASIPAVRLDSGDLCELSKQVRQILDEAGMNATKIFASSDLDEYEIERLLSNGAEIDWFGVGTQLTTSYDSPALSGVYKLAAIEENGRFSMRIKLSHDKATYPGAKQVWRLIDKEDHFAKDIISLADEPAPGDTSGVWKPLLKQVMSEGHCELKSSPSNDENRDLQNANARESQIAYLNEARDLALASMRSLPNSLKSLDSTSNYPVQFSSLITAEQEALKRVKG